LQRGADVRAVDSMNRTVPMWAASGGSEALVQQLLAAGLDVNAADEVGATALIGATNNGRGHLVPMLLVRGRGWGQEPVFGGNSRAEVGGSRSRAEQRPVGGNSKPQERQQEAPDAG